MWLLVKEGVDLVIVWGGLIRPGLNRRLNVRLSKGLNWRLNIRLSERLD